MVRHPAWWYLTEPPQGRNAARAGELFQVRGVSWSRYGGPVSAVRRYAAGVSTGDLGDDATSTDTSPATGSIVSAVAEPAGTSIADRVTASLQQLRHGRDDERTPYFSDAVFAIAMTLLVLDLRVPESTPAEAHAFAEAVLEKVPAFVGFVVSFFLLGTTWMTHHRRFRAIVAYDSRLQRINLLVLFFVAFMPVPCGLLFQPSGASAIPPILYATTIAGMMLALTALWAYAHGAGLLSDDVSEPLYRLGLRATHPVVAVMLGSIPLAFLDPIVCMMSWIAVGPLSIGYGRWARRRFVIEETARLAALDRADLSAAPPLPSGAPAVE